MNETATSIGAVSATLAAHLAAGLGLGLLAGYLGRTLFGLVAAIVLVSALTGSAETAIGFMARGVSQFPRQEVVAFLKTTGGIATLAGFITGLCMSLRRG